VGAPGQVCLPSLVAVTPLRRDVQRVRRGGLRPEERAPRRRTLADGAPPADGRPSNPTSRRASVAASYCKSRPSKRSRRRRGGAAFRRSCTFQKKPASPSPPVSSRLALGRLPQYDAAVARNRIETGSPLAPPLSGATELGREGVQSFLDRGFRGAAHKSFPR